MKMNYRRNNNKRRKTTTLLIALFFLFFAFSFGDKILDTSSRIASALAYPVWKSNEKLSSLTSAISTFFVSKNSLQKENEFLRDELGKLKVEQVVYRYVLDENKKLKEILNRSDDKELILARVISNSSKSVYDSFVIDVGENDGVRNGDIVIVDANVAVGFIAKTSKNTSNVVLFSSKSQKIDVLLGENSIPATAIGRNGGNFEIKIPRDIELDIGEVVTVPDTYINILGTVEYIQREANDPFQIAFVKSPVNIYEMKWLEVIKSSSVGSDDFKKDGD